MFHLLSDPTRLRMLRALAGRGEMTAAGLGEAAGRSRSAASIHLGLLRRGGRVAPRREGHRVYYRLSSPLAAALVRLACGGMRRARKNRTPGRRKKPGSFPTLKGLQ
jgi:DNA-binding transcriptional ArsR family regulator